MTLAAVLALFLAAVAGASFAAALEAAAVFLGGMSDFAFLMVLMRASLMDYRVCERVVEKVAVGGWFWYAVASRSRAILLSRDKSFDVINLRRENKSLVCRGWWVKMQCSVVC